MPTRIIKISFLLSMAAWMATAQAWPGTPPGARAAPLLNIISVDHLVVRLNDKPVDVQVAGIAGHPNCPQADSHWARAMLAPHPAVYIDPAGPGPDRTGRLQRRVAFLYRGQWVDYGLTALQEGHAVTRAAPSGVIDPAAYARMEDEARAESRGLWNACHSPLEAFQAAAHSFGLAPETLYGVAMNESFHHGRPWPWTLNVQGQPHYYPDRVSAWRAAERLLRQRINTFDIGLMQVNWKWHGNRFQSTWDALGPEKNQRVAAAILAENLKAHGSLKAAVGRYHSANPHKAAQYWRRFQLQLRQLRAALWRE